MTARVGVAAVALLCLLVGCSPSGPITPEVTFAGLDPDLPGYVTATGSVSGVSEDEGKCVFTFWAASGAATRLTGQGKATGASTQCGPVTQALGFMVGGNYEVELKYEALTGETVTSARVAMTLPTPVELNP